MMSAFNVLNVRSLEESEEDVLRLQFKYGDVWQHEYEIGDTLKWGGNDYGQKGVNRVIVDATDEGSDIEVDYYIVIVNNIIIHARINTGQYDFGKHGDTFIIESA